MSEQQKYHADYVRFIKDRKTNPKYTKQVNVNGKPPFTNIDTYYLIEEASKEFGLFGKGWGIKDSRYETLVIGDTTLLTLHTVFWFENGWFPITNSIKMAYATKGGYQKIDEDAYKKLETNTISKALSRIGFGLDIYRGSYEDPDYVNEAWGESEINQQQRQELTAIATQRKLSIVPLNKHFGIDKLTELKQVDFDKAKAFLLNFPIAKNNENHA